ncbi:tRNA (N(6)-L-threonylcarbamoyladenosine(37)-C(2))-methylthiotransferase MtaB [Alkalibacter rhizosphaerae]|uniref:Threonylcarbamoyladenosine tRNA methylthiotransferase MtaB n=1 Tax=Alkalibacter rhizosphaerae TaxID=2815577 RepID=A0A975AH98_9FIRM|nr:tRNA (N(6)-L-threonylcarbamoyladenosine(37)-C(2))-methylthiotransferase MtaB [Alkalibacter rhizosphaerae]QSX08389.1 tRNA (N(6)-L-threonylcarbamoyladenosine(37)-C(2))-methylthiotransferase MtaB [Alkalibacter rhizosphaerae]
MKTAAIHTLGCKVNTYDSEAILELLKKDSYNIVEFEEKADVYIVNTCTVTNLGDKKSRQMIRRAKKNNPGAFVIVCGCYAQTASEELEGMPEVDLILGNDDRHRIVEFIEEGMASQTPFNAVKDIMKVREYEELHIDHLSGHERGFIKIQEGCDQFCTYCIIPYARGPVRSRKPENIIEEGKRLIANGNRELVLTGINISAYGKDLKNAGDLAALVEMLDGLDGLERIRLGSLEPSYLTQEVVDRMKGSEKLCDHFHVSLQSGAVQTLKDMKRRYAKEEYALVLERIRMAFPHAGITTDVMVGFPGETEEDFLETMDFVKTMAFSQIHVFKYSPRKGTPAAAMDLQIPEAIKQERSEKLIALGNELKKDFEDRFFGEISEVLVEQEIHDKKNTYQGHTTNYLLLPVSSATDIRGHLVQVRISRDVEGRLIGESL